MQTKSLDESPTHANLKNAGIYIMVDPDTEKESDQPNFVQPNDVDPIYDWVKDGGVLLLFSHDSENVAFTHFNKLAEKFGIQFYYDIKNKVRGSRFKIEKIPVAAGNLIFSKKNAWFRNNLGEAADAPNADIINTHMVFDKR